MTFAFGRPAAFEGEDDVRRLPVAQDLLKIADEPEDGVRRLALRAGHRGDAVKDLKDERIGVDQVKRLRHRSVRLNAGAGTGRWGTGPHDGGGLGASFGDPPVGIVTAAAVADIIGIVATGGLAATRPIATTRFVVASAQGDPPPAAEIGGLTTVPAHLD